MNTREQREKEREAVKTLAIAVGVREAARQLGLNEARVLQWSKRDQWFKPTPQPPKQSDVITVIKPSDAMANVLSERRDKSKLHLSEYVEKASYRAAMTQDEALLKVSGDVKNVAMIRQGLWPEENQAQSPLNLQVLSQNTVISIGQNSLGDTQSPQGE